MQYLGVLGFYLVSFIISQAAAKEVWDFCEPDADYLSTSVDVKVIGCKRSPCEVVRGINSTLIITFTPTIETSGLYMKLYGKVGPLTIPSGPTKDICPLAPPCKEKPGLIANKEYVVTFPYPISKNYPKFPVTCRVRLLNPQEQTLVCVDIPLVITDSTDEKVKKQEYSISSTSSLATTISSSSSVTTTDILPSRSTSAEEEEYSTEWEMVAVEDLSPKVEKAQAAIVADSNSSGANSRRILFPSIFTVLLAVFLGFAH